MKINISVMDVRLKFIFEDSDFGDGFEILNPPVVPVKGDHVDFDWKSYVPYEKQRDLIESFEENHDLVADILESPTPQRK